MPKCKHKNTTEIDWPDNSSVELCKDCGMSRNHWEFGESDWIMIEDVGQAKKDVQKSIDRMLKRAEEKRNMQKIIYKYKITHGETIINLPKGTEVLCFKFKEQEEFPKIWVIQDNHPIEYEDRQFNLLTTGKLFATKKSMIYIGTVTLYADELYHLFELKE